jgi:hypothetical protein
MFRGVAAWRSLSLIKKQNTFNPAYPFGPSHLPENFSQQQLQLGASEMVAPRE